MELAVKSRVVVATIGKVQIWEAESVAVVWGILGAVSDVPGTQRGAKREEDETKLEARLT